MVVEVVVVVVEVVVNVVVLMVAAVVGVFLVARIKMKSIAKPTVAAAVAHTRAGVMTFLTSRQKDLTLWLQEQRFRSTSRFCFQKLQHFSTKSSYPSLPRSRTLKSNEAFELPFSASIILSYYILVSAKFLGDWQKD